MHEIAGVGFIVRATTLQYMYSPQTWGHFAKDILLDPYNLVNNGTLAQLVQVAEETGTSVIELLSGGGLLPHNDQQLAIEAGDAGDVPSNVTTQDIFGEFVRYSREVSEYCAYFLPLSSIRD
jgi:hypothetical protein